MTATYRQIYHSNPDMRNLVCVHAHAPFNGAIPNTGARQCTMCGAKFDSEEELIQARLWAKKARDYEEKKLIEMEQDAAYCMDIGELVFNQAQEIFIQCGTEEDFCVQDVGSVAVFGGTNRLIFSPRKGFYPDKSYCTDRFIDLFNDMFAICK